MKKTFFIFFLLTFLFSYAQEYKPYKLKSGKIEYELRKYKTHSHYTNDNGVKSQWKESVPYVAGIIVYYWDEYGDEAFEEYWEVADFAGNPVTETKEYEMLWKDGHHYYYNFKEGRYRDDPDNIRAECLERFQFYQITGSWVEAAYGGVKKGNTRVLGREAVHYEANDAMDIYTWKGLPLKTETFETTREGKRLKTESTRIATDIVTGLVFDRMMFDPVRMEQDNDFANLTMDEIGGIIDGNPDKIRQIDESGYEIREGDVILYVTSDINLGKMKVLKIRNDSVDIKFVTYDNTGNVISQSSDLPVRNNYTCDLDRGTASEDRMYRQEFRYKKNNRPELIPFPTLGFYLVKASRK
jgi:hypothetical protein